MAKTHKGISLNEAHRALQRELGEHAPARITLHRHSAAGHLEKLVIDRTGSRAYYSLQGLIQHYRPAQNAARQPPHTEQPPQAGPTPAPLLSPEQTAAALVRQVAPLIERQVAQALLPIAQTLTKIEAGLSDLANTRSMLMLKYDAAAVQQLQRLEDAKAEITRLRNATSTDMVLMRMQGELSRVLDALRQLTPPP